MKLNNLNKGIVLGQNIVQKGDLEREIKIASKRFGLTKTELMKNGVKINDVEDKLGMLMTVLALGDEIAPTIRLGQNICAIDFEQFTNEDGVLGDNAVHVALMYSGLYWACWDKEAKQIDMKKACQIVDARPDKKLEPIYTENDVFLDKNKLDMERWIFVVSDYYIRRAENAFKAINKNTTLEELKAFQKDFNFPTRGLGEQTIDVTKHIDYVFYCIMKQLVSPYAKVAGGLKKLTSNVKTYRRTKELYTIAPEKDEHLYEDVIGHFKQASVDTMENRVRAYIEDLENNTNLDHYKEYNDVDFAASVELYELACMIDAIEDSMLNMDRKTIDRSLAAVYNKADEFGIDRKMVFKIAMKLAICEVRKVKGVTYFVPVLGTEKEYKADLWKPATLFGDIFVAEYCGTDTIEVPVKYETEIDIEEGEVIDIVDGYGYGGMLHVFGPFQNGKVKVNDGELVALYNPLETLVDKYPDAIVVPVESYAKDFCTHFSKYEPATIEDLDINDLKSFGFMSLVDNNKARLAKSPKTNSVAIVSINGNKLIAAGKASPVFTMKNSDVVVKDLVCFKNLIVADVHMVIK